MNSDILFELSKVRVFATSSSSTSYKMILEKYNQSTILLILFHNFSGIENFARLKIIFAANSPLIS